MRTLCWGDIFTGWWTLLFLVNGAACVQESKWIFNVQTIAPNQKPNNQHSRGTPLSTKLSSTNGSNAFRSNPIPRFRFFYFLFFSKDSLEVQRLKIMINNLFRLFNARNTSVNYVMWIKTCCEWSEINPRQQPPEAVSARSILDRYLLKLSTVHDWHIFGLDRCQIDLTALCSWRLKLSDQPSAFSGGLTRRPTDMSDAFISKMFCIFAV